MSFPRCPTCGAVAMTTDVGHRHRPPCDYTDTDPRTWTEEAHA